MKFEDILETCKTNTHAKSWDEFAWMLGLSTEGLRLIRKGRGALKPATLEAIMRGSGIEAPIIVATWEAEHGKNPYVRESWGRLAAACHAAMAENGPDSNGLGDSVYYVK